MLKIAVVGGAETVMGFKALGLEACPVANAEEARRTLHRLTRESEDYAIIYIEENLAQELEREIDKYKDVPKPAIILIPGREGPLGLGQSALKAATFDLPVEPSLGYAYIVPFNNYKDGAKRMGRLHKDGRGAWLQHFGQRGIYAALSDGRSRQDSRGAERFPS